MTEPFFLAIAAEIKSLPEIHRFIIQAGLSLGGNKDVVDDLRLAVEEAVANIIQHGYRGQGGIIQIQISREKDMLIIYIADDAPPFDPTIIPPPDLNLPLSERPLGGVGIQLMKLSVDKVVHRIGQMGGNELTLFKNLAAQ